MTITQAHTDFIASHHDAAVITIGADGLPKPVRIVYTVIDGAIWSSGTRGRVRTERHRRDPQATLFVWDPPYHFVSVHTTVEVLDGDDAIDLNVRYFRELQGKPSGPLSWMGEGSYEEDEYRELLAKDERIIYRFTPVKSFGSL